MRLSLIADTPNAACCSKPALANEHDAAANDQILALSTYDLGRCGVLQKNNAMPDDGADCTYRCVRHLPASTWLGGSQGTLLTSNLLCTTSF